MKILLAVDGSKHSRAVVDYLVDHLADFSGKPEVELVTVHLPLPRLPHMSMVVGKQQVAKYYEEEGEACLAPAKKRLDAAGIAYSSRVLVGPVAETIVKQ